MKKNKQSQEILKINIINQNQKMKTKLNILNMKDYLKN